MKLLFCDFVILPRLEFAQFENAKSEMEKESIGSLLYREDDHVFSILNPP